MSQWIFGLEIKHDTNKNKKIYEISLYIRKFQCFRTTYPLLEELQLLYYINISFFIDEQVIYRMDDHITLIC